MSARNILGVCSVMEAGCTAPSSKPAFRSELLRDISSGTGVGAQQHVIRGFLSPRGQFRCGSDEDFRVTLAGNDVFRSGPSQELVENGEKLERAGILRDVG